MSYIVLPDPNPGRCPNHRLFIGPNGESETLRCLDYAAVPHVCSFPEPKLRLDHGLGWGTGNLTVPKPLPWVKPGDAPRSSTTLTAATPDRAAETGGDNGGEG